MPRVPDSIPRISGIINSHHTTPLSHTNVLAHSWSIPNAIQIGAFEKYNHLNNSWVSYEVDENNQAISLMATTKPENSHMKPAWKKHFIKLEEPDHDYTPIKSLADLRLTDRYIYGTKAANLGELHHIRSKGSSKMLGFYRIPRGPRPNYLPYLERYFNVSGESSIEQSINDFVSRKINVPRGIALPFSIQKKVSRVITCHPTVNRKAKNGSRT